MQILAQNTTVSIQNDDRTCRIYITITNDELKSLRCPYCKAPLTRYGYYVKQPRGAEFSLSVYKIDFPEIKDSIDNLIIVVPRLCCNSEGCPVASNNPSQVTTFGLFNPKIFMPFKQYAPKLFDLMNAYWEADRVRQEDSSTKEEKAGAEKSINKLIQQIYPQNKMAGYDFFESFYSPERKRRLKAAVKKFKAGLDYYFDKLTLTSYFSPEKSAQPLINKHYPHELPTESVFSSILNLLSNFVPLLPTQIVIVLARNYWKMPLNQDSKLGTKGLFNDSS